MCHDKNCSRESTLAIKYKYGQPRTLSRMYFRLNLKKDQRTSTKTSRNRLIDQS